MKGGNDMVLKKLFLLSGLALGFSSIQIMVSNNDVSNTNTVVIHKDYDPDMPDNYPVTSDTEDEKLEDAVENYYNEHIRDQYMFGISLGSLIGLISSIVTSIVIIVKNVKSNKQLRDNNKQTIETIEKLRAEFEKEKAEYVKDLEAREKIIADYAKDMKRVVDQYNDLSKVLVYKTNEASDKLSRYAETEDKINRISQAIVALSKNPDNVKTGISSEVNSIINSRD